MKRFSWLLLMVLFANPFSYFRMTAHADEESPALLEEVKLFTQTLNTVKRWYVDETEARKLFYHSAHGMFESLDKYSEFIEPERFKLLREQIAGKYAGIGTALKEEEGLVVINDIQPGSAAEKAGLELEDQIMGIDGISTEGKPVENLTSLIHGDENTTVMLSVLKRSTGEIINLELMREAFEVRSVQEGRMVGDDIGYLHITHFRENTVAQVDKMIEELKENGMKGLIVDLRGNSGGVLERAVKIAGRFLPESTNIVSVFSKIQDQNKQFAVEKEATPYEIPLLLLVNEQTASTAEIFTAALQDHKRAIVVGARTYGKATAQSIIPLKDGSGMKLTTARYIRPNGQAVSDEGIKPDYLVDEAPEDESLAQYQTKIAVSIMKGIITPDA